MNENDELIKNEKFYRLLKQAFEEKIIIQGFIEHLKLLEKYEEYYIDFYKEIKKLVTKYDPFNIARVSEDEYDPEIRDILTALINKQDKSVNYYFEKIKSIFEDWFFIAEEKEGKYYEIAEGLFDWVNKRKAKINKPN